MPVIDCTIRDGGYYNNWDFSQHLVQKYLQVMGKAKVDYVEIGFRSFKNGPGTYATVTDGALEEMKKPAGCKFAVMINAKEALAFPQGVDHWVLSLFTWIKHSRVSLVRVAAQFHEIASCERICKALKALGYEVALNLMQCSGKGMNAIYDASKIVFGWGLVDVFYIADSLGSLDPFGAWAIVDNLQQIWGKQVGVHMHDNRGMALANTVSAEATWKDSTVAGMGRGAGNTRTEQLLTALGAPYNADPVFDLVRTDFSLIQAIYGWGPTQLYFLSGTYEVHPTFVQTMVSAAVPHKVSLIVLKKLRDAKARMFDSKMLQAFIKESA